MPGVLPWWGEYARDLRLGDSIDLIPLNGVETLWTLLLFSVFQEPRPTKINDAECNARLVVVRAR
jgi:hypothetical protein